MILYLKVLFYLSAIFCIINLALWLYNTNIDFLFYSLINCICVIFAHLNLKNLQMADDKYNSNK